jgi:protein-S-isoprenylcysteine O-methyltransferase Ste14
MLAYALFLVTFLYAIGFVGNVAVPKSIDSHAAAPSLGSLLVNLALLGLFAIQHSVMARIPFKKAWTRIVPAPVERSTYVMFTCLALGLLFWQWRPMGGAVWEIENPVGSIALQALFWAGWGVVLLSSFIIDHFDLFGLRQVYLNARGEAYSYREFKVSTLYKYVRHPLLLGFLIAFWATPRMTVGHLMFALTTTAYILIAIRLEERDLVRLHGTAYEDYQRRVPMLAPSLKALPTSAGDLAAPGRNAADVASR